MLDLRLGDCLEVLKTIPENSIDSCVTDPPYGFAFMGKKWDYELPSVETWREILRVLKPGAHLLAFGGPRTYHRLTCGIEDAGFEIRDQIQWNFGSGFPKSLDVSKAIDKMYGLKGEIIEQRKPGIVNGMSKSRVEYGARPTITTSDIRAPASQDAIKWQGWGTALKPANEPICLARKPLSEDTVAKNVLKWGTGGLNIDGCRIETNQALVRPNIQRFNNNILGGGLGAGTQNEPKGRFPANLILSHSPNCIEEACDMFECAVKHLDDQSGFLRGAGNKKLRKAGVGKESASIFGVEAGAPTVLYDRGGSASRFFYCAKVSSRERNQGCDVVSIDPWESQDLSQKTANLSQLVKDISEDILQFISDKSWSTDLYGHSISEMYPKGFRFTIETVLKLITELKISSLSAPLTTNESIRDAIKTIEANGLSLAESVEFLNRLDRTTIREETASLLGVSSAVLQTLLIIKEFAEKKESEDGVGTKNVHPT